MEDFISQCHAVAKGAWKYRFSSRVFVDTESILRVPVFYCPAWPTCPIRNSGCRFDDKHDTREAGLQAWWRMKLNARTRSTINAGTNRVSMAVIGRTDRHQWSRQLRASVELRHARQSSKLIPGSAHENALAVTLSALL